MEVKMKCLFAPADIRLLCVWILAFVKPSITSLALIVVLSWASSSPANIVIAQWTFETSVPASEGPHTAEGGVSAATSFASTNSGGTITNPIGNGSAESFNSNGWANGEYFQFTTNTIGFHNVWISFAQAASATGPRDFQFQYSTDGTNYVNFGPVYAGPTTDFISATTSSPGNILTFDLSLVTGLYNQAAVGFRVAVSGTKAENGLDIGGAGTFRVDDFTVNGVSAVPEPSSLVLSIAMMGSAWICRRRLVSQLANSSFS